LGEKKTIGMSSTNKDAKGSQFVFWTLQVRARFFFLPSIHHIAHFTPHPWSDITPAPLAVPN
jgi:hypothetical protein